MLDALLPDENVPEDCPMHPTEAYQMVVEQIVETDDDLMSRYLEGETLGLVSSGPPPAKAIAHRPARPRRLPLGEARTSA